MDFIHSKKISSKVKKNQDIFKDCVFFIFKPYILHSYMT